VTRSPPVEAHRPVVTYLQLPIHICFPYNDHAQRATPTWHRGVCGPQISIIYSRFITCQSNTSKGRGHDRLPNWNPKNGGMLISQPVTSCVTNHRELCMSRLLSNQSRRISQRRPFFGFESSVSSSSPTNADPVVCTNASEFIGVNKCALRRHYKHR